VPVVFASVEVAGSSASPEWSVALLADYFVRRAGACRVDGNVGEAIWHRSRIGLSFEAIASEDFWQWQDERERLG
jgi:hypothetical protein